MRYPLAQSFLCVWHSSLLSAYSLPYSSHSYADIPVHISCTYTHTYVITDVDVLQSPPASNATGSVTDALKISRTDVKHAPLPAPIGGKRKSETIFEFTEREKS